MKARKYRRKYQDARKDEAYRLFVDGKASQGDLHRLLGIPPRTIARWSKTDGWVGERSDRERAASHGSAVAAITGNVADVAATGPVSFEAVPVDETSDLETKLAAAMLSDGAVERIGAVMTRQRRYWDRLADHLFSQLEDTEAKATNAGKKISFGQLFPFAKLGEMIMGNQRKAHGIADITKMELTGKGGGPVEVAAVRGMSDDQLDRELQEAERAALAAATRKAPAGRIN